MQINESNDDHDKKLTIRGNPVQNGILDYTYSSDLKGDVTISLYDHNGRLVKEKKEDYKRKISGTLSLDGAAPGSYYITVRQGSILSTKKFIVQ